MPKLPPNVDKRGGKYFYRVQIRGKRARVYLADSLPEARRLARVMASAPRRAHAPGPETAAHLSVADFAGLWLENDVGACGRPRTAKQSRIYRQYMVDYVLPVIGSVSFGDLTRYHLNQVALRLARENRTRTAIPRPLHPTTQAKVLKAVGRMLAWAVEQDIVDHAPSLAGLAPRIVRGQPDPLIVEEVAAILEACRPQHRAPVQLALATGLRWSEQIALTWRDVDRAGRCLQVRNRTAHHRKSHHREIPLTRAALEALDAMRGDSLMVQMWRPQSPRWVALYTGSTTGVAWHWHQLRHTFASDLLARGVPLAVVKDVLGHASIATSEIYAGLNRTAVFSAVLGTESGPKSGPSEPVVTPIEGAK